MIHLAISLSICFVIWASADFSTAAHFLMGSTILWLVIDRMAMRHELEERCREFNAWASRQSLEGFRFKPAAPTRAPWARSN